MLGLRTQPDEKAWVHMNTVSISSRGDRSSRSGKGFSGNLAESLGRLVPWHRGADQSDEVLDLVHTLPFDTGGQISQPFTVDFAGLQRKGFIGRPTVRRRLAVTCVQCVIDY